MLLIDKPSRMTSFDVIRRLRRIYTEGHNGAKAPKMGHAGTLDPLATGLMIIGVGSGTKRLTEHIKLDKEYVAEVLVGDSRTTGDMEGEVIDSVEAVEISPTEISTAVNCLVGTINLPVSAYSAIKKDGKPMYKRAREAAKLGEVVKDVPWREMTVYEAEIEDIYVKEVEGKKRMIVRVRFFVGSGTYIRSLAEELGRHLGYPACLYSLRRTKIGKFSVEEADTLDKK